MDSESEAAETSTPPEVRTQAEKAEKKLIPQKSRDKYEYAYKAFNNWKKQKNTSLTSQNILMAYFDELAAKYKPSTLWSQYSMLKTTIQHNEKINIGTYNPLISFLKSHGKGFRSKKSNVLTSKEIETFLKDAPNNTHLATKVRIRIQPKQ